MNRFYIYMWYFTDTNEVFYIGKGVGERYKDVVGSRNQYFKNIVSKYNDRVDVKFYKTDLTEDESFELEKKLIKEYWDKGECKANFHEGGRGGNTGNYDSEERSRKISESAKKRVGKLNPMYGRTHSEETRELLRKANIGKKLSEEHKQKLILANKTKKKTAKQIEHITNLNKGKKMPKEAYDKMMLSLCEYRFDIFLDSKQVTSCLGHTALYKFCKSSYNISRRTVDKIVLNEWFPKFERHKHLETLKIVKVSRKCID